MTDNKDDRKVCDTLVTIDTVQDVIAHKVGVPDAKVTEWTAVDVSLGKGFLSCMAKIDLTWSLEHPDLPKSVMCKIPTTTKLTLMTKHNPDMAGMQEQMERDLHVVGAVNMEYSTVTKSPKVHNAEVSIYEVFEKYGVESLIPIAKIYGCKRLPAGGQHTESAYIIMQNMGDVAGHKFLLNMETLDDHQSKEILSVLAKFHVWSIRNMEAINKMETKDLMDAFSMELANVEKSIEKFKVDMKTDAWKTCLTQEQIDQVPQLAIRNKEQLFEINKIHRQANIPSVLCHGDVHVNNMLFEFDDQGKPNGKLAALIDWQIIHIGNPCEDLARVFLMCIDRKHRNLSAARAFIDFYYDEFEKAVGQKLEFDKDALFKTFKHTYSIMGRLFIPIFPSFAVAITSGELPGADVEVALPRCREDFQLMYQQSIDIMNEMKLT